MSTPTPTPPKPEGNASNGNPVCVVGCKLPHGLKMELFEKDAGGVLRVVASHTVKGHNDARIVGGYGLTPNVPTDFMEEWIKRNAEHPAVKNGSIFMQTGGKSAEARAKEGRGIRTGIEPVHPIEDAKRFKMDLGPQDEKQKHEAAYRKQVAENPVRNRQIVE